MDEFVFTYVILKLCGVRLVQVKYFHTQPSFTSSITCYSDSNNVMTNSNYTNMNRKDVDWKRLAYYLDDKYRNQEKVKINCFGCSDGSEPYTLAIYLIKELGFSKAQKFFPIEASDISEDVIRDAKQGNILLNDKDVNFLESMQSKEFFKRNYDNDSQNKLKDGLSSYKVDDKLKNCINFSVKNIKDETSKTDFSNQVVIFRNAWTFNDVNSQKEIAKGLSDKSNEKTLVIIGQGDLSSSGASDFLQKSGFSGVRSNIFTAAEKPFAVNTNGQVSSKQCQDFILFEKHPQMKFFV